MKTWLGTFILALTLALGSCHSSFMSQEKILSPDEFEIGYSKHPDAILIDIRTPEEIKNGHLKDAIFIDYHDQHFEEQLAYLRKDLSYYIYCSSADKTIHTARLMSSMGFKKVFVLQGGIKQWHQQGKKIIHPQT
ncbi:rhodanese-like domain-containing protein [Litoribacter ruber]|uniref:Rhodanese-like domain-containing protein n=1 Tax=Litoribacter ruber TaxID=702568 RepID=A0AAP2CN14_9BACT|nr:MULTISPECIES: rhodanese-like domain-containing protein [Litoribacter]MBS9524787.1 rhodanese-like domain-containing protein [Litoribacter alkaliphilus]MBT0812630.1 rhodanese-like domain-containing protein [Litoribacter ruber]